MCLAGTVVASWSLIPGVAGSSPFAVKANIFSLNLANSVKTFRENLIILNVSFPAIDSYHLLIHDNKCPCI